MRASRINTIFNRYANNMANQKPYIDDALRAERLNNIGRPSAARAVIRNMTNRQYTRNQYMNGVTG